MGAPKEEQNEEAPKDEDKKEEDGGDGAEESTEDGAGQGDTNKKVDDDGVSEETEQKKSRLRGLSIDKLKKKCKGLKISSEGNKTDMIERILAHDEEEMKETVDVDEAAKD